MSADNRSKRVLVIGGSGRVGGSTVRALRQVGRERGWNLKTDVGGRNPDNFEKARVRWINELQSGGDVYNDVDFVTLDHEDPAGLKAALSQHKPDLIVHTAGPFQRKKDPVILKASLDLKIPYVDVCDDIDLSQVAKSYDNAAKAAGVPMLISTGVWPGISSLMAVECAEALSGAEKTQKIDFQFYTAGSGNAGATILSATFLILSEKVLAFVDGQAKYFTPASDFQMVDFGPGIGPRQIFRMNLLEAFSCNKVLGIPNVATFFGTAPDFWNYLLKGMTLLPTKLLRDRKAMQALALLSEPVVRIVDRLVGSTNAMKVVATSKIDGSQAEALFAHEDLETCVGLGVAAFAFQVLEGRVKSGVHYPEEVFTTKGMRDDVFEIGCKGTFSWVRPTKAASVGGREVLKK